MDDPMTPSTEDRRAASLAKSARLRTTASEIMRTSRVLRAEAEALMAASRRVIRRPGRHP